MRSCDAGAAAAQAAAGDDGKESDSYRLCVQCTSKKWKKCDMSEHQDFWIWKWYSFTRSSQRNLIVHSLFSLLPSRITLNLVAVVFAARQLCGIALAPRTSVTSATRTIRMGVPKDKSRTIAWSARRTSNALYGVLASNTPTARPTLASKCSVCVGQFRNALAIMRFSTFLVVLYQAVVIATPHGMPVVQ